MDFDYIFIAIIAPFPLIIFLFSLVKIVRYSTEWLRLRLFRPIPQYELPRQLSPAMVEALLRGRISTKKVWPATIVDLASRGYLSIQEVVQPNYYEKTVKILTTSLVSIAIVVFLWHAGWSGLWLPLLALLLLPFAHGGLSARPVYIIDLNTDADMTKLDLFETELMSFLFPSGTRYQTRRITNEMNKMIKSFGSVLLQLLSAIVFKSGFTHHTEPGSRRFRSDDYKRAFRYWILRKRILNEAARKTGVYTVGFEWWIWFRIIAFFGLVILLSFLVFFFFNGIYSETLQRYVLIGGVIWSIGAILLRPRLTPAGHMLRKKLRSFQAYVTNPQRYQSHAPNPELFERYLAHAMLFGSAKRWGKNFEGVDISVPAWYSVRMAYGTSGQEKSRSVFSPSGFSKNFPNRFTAEFISTQ